MPTTNSQHLILIKNLYEDACTLAAREDDLSVMKATLLLDHSVEQMLNTIIMDMTARNVPAGGPGRKDSTWKEIWKRASEAMESRGLELLNHTQLLSLHEVRNLAQHNGSIPTQAEVKRYMEPVEEMLASAFRDAYQLDFATFRIWDLVPNESLRQLLRDSEHAFEQGFPGLCMMGCTQAHNVVIKAIRENTKLRRVNVSQVFSNSRGQSSVPSSLPYELRSKLEHAARQVDAEIKRATTQFRNEIMKEIEFLEDEVVAIGVGMPLMDTRRFLKLGAEVVLPLGRGPFRGVVLDKLEKNTEEDRKSALFMLQYLSRLVRLINEAYPEVIATVEVPLPLTSQPWWNGIVTKSASCESSTISD